MAMADSTEKRGNDSTIDEVTSTFDPFLPPAEPAEGESKNQQDEDIDPFHVGMATARTRAIDIIKKKKLEAEAKTLSSSASVATRGSTALPPRIDVKFMTHEEASSTAMTETKYQGASDVFVEGTVLAQVTSSDALKNAPFILLSTSPSGAKVDFTPSDTFAKSYATKGGKGNVNVIKIPKSTLGFVKVGTYVISEKVGHMPLLLERKVSRSKSKVQVAIQVRSKLTNNDDLTDFSIALSMPEQVLGDTVEINAGEGEWDRLKRTIVWKVPVLAKGESCMVSARAKHSRQADSIEDSELQFPVMLRCKSQDRISTAQFQAIEASGYPATVSSTTVGHTFRILHRLQ